MLESVSQLPVGLNPSAINALTRALAAVPGGNLLATRASNSGDTASGED
jgi:hypothetical protein